MLVWMQIQTSYTFCLMCFKFINSYDIFYFLPVIHLLKNCIMFLFCGIPYTYYLCGFGPIMSFATLFCPLFLAVNYSNWELDQIQADFFFHKDVSRILVHLSVVQRLVYSVSWHIYHNISYQPVTLWMEQPLMFFTQIQSTIRGS